jgi:hypothetical protein
LQPKFDLTLRIIDLTNVPLIAGTAYVKWHLSSSSAAEHRGRTDKAPIRDHKATWEYNKELAVRLTIEKNLMLQECDIDFEIVQEYQQNARGGRVILGNVKLNLAEYTQLPELSADRDPQEEEDGAITRRYLLQDSKINSTLKIGVKMKQTEGDTNFVAPPLKSAMIAGGIAGVLTTEAGDGEDMPTITSKTRELSEVQDLYRRTLAATWACSNGELAPDKLIEDLFSGGNGGLHPAALPRPQLGRAAQIGGRDESMGSSSSDAESKRTITPHHLTPDMARHGNYGHRRRGSSEAIPSQNGHMGSISGRASLDQQMQQSQREQRRKKHGGTPELTEFDLRDDLRSWRVGMA